MQLRLPLLAAVIAGEDIHGLVLEGVLRWAEHSRRLEPQPCGEEVT